MTYFLNCIFISQAIFAGLIGSLATWLLIILSKRIYHLCIYNSLNGSYLGKDFDKVVYHKNKVYFVKYNFFKNSLFIELYISSNPEWKTEFILYEWNSISRFANYFYCKNDGGKNDWGVQQIWINNKEKSITIDAFSRDHEGKGHSIYCIYKNENTKICRFFKIKLFFHEKLKKNDINCNKRNCYQD